MNKRDLLERILARLSADLKLLTNAAIATHAEATDEENKAEDKYDTRGLEASYLAHGQSKAAAEAAEALSHFQALALRPFGPGEPIGLGALVTLEGKGLGHYFMGPRAGGMEIEVDGSPVLVITPQSPLGRQLLGRRAGDRLQLDFGGKRSEYLVGSVS